MNNLTTTIQQELFRAMDDYNVAAHILMDKLISETNQPEKEKIATGAYYAIEEADLLNGAKTLSDNWWFEVHGEHCFFRNLKTKQELEVYLGNRESVSNLDPIFFFNFLKTTKKWKHLIVHFENPFADVLNFFEEMVLIQKMENVGGLNFRKINE